MNINRTNRQVNSFGIFLLFIYPGAFVDISDTNSNLVSEENERSNNAFSSLKIICAGGTWTTQSFSSFTYLSLHY
jgi:hypothetical protein